MNKLRYLAFGVCLLFGLPAARATTVIAPTFDELVSKAELIFQGSVTNVRSQWVGEGAQRHIASFITFKVEETLKGQPGASYTMQMLGGTVNGETLAVSDAPKFAVGDHDILFVEHNGSSSFLWSASCMDVFGFSAKRKADATSSPPMKAIN